MSNPLIFGWDIGGAHLKLAILNLQGSVINVIQRPCPVWKGIDELKFVVNEILEAYGVPNAQHFVTMTAELVDIFPNRKAGVIAIADLLNQMLEGQMRSPVGKQVHFYSSQYGFLKYAQVLANADSIASANWHASASMLAQYFDEALLVDIGSTTTDIVPIHKRQVACKGWSDAQRMQHDELIYTGVVRTPLMALGAKIAFNNHMTNIAAEYFATTADIYRLTGDLLPEDDMVDTADGQQKSSLQTCTRLARMVGEDADNHPQETWHQLALAFKTQQLGLVMKPIQQYMVNNPDRNLSLLVGAGCGRFLVKEIAAQLGLQYKDAECMMKGQPWVATCLPAFSVANLGLQQIALHA